VQAFGVVGGIWTIAEVTSRASSAANKWLDAHGAMFLTLIMAGFALRFISHIYEVRSVRFSLPTTNTKITIRFGDLFDANTDWLIGVNEFFDSSLGQIVSPRSVHGQVIAKAFGGDEQRFRSATDQALQGFVGEPTARAQEPKIKFPIGTTAVVMNGSHRIFLMAMAHTDLVTHKATSTVPILWNALRGAFQSVAANGNGEPLTMPLVGNGRSSVNIEPQHLLRLIVLAIVDFGRTTALPNELTIAVPEDCFSVLDIREIRRDWSARNGL